MTHYPTLLQVTLIYNILEYNTNILMLSCSSFHEENEEDPQYEDERDGIYEPDRVFVTDGLSIDRITLNAWRQSIEGVGQRFEDVYSFRDCLLRYAIAVGFLYEFIQNDTKRVTVVCHNKEDKCNWRIHASVSKVTSTFSIKKADLQHTCDIGLKKISTQRLGESFLWQ
jgi:hypothetical protein